MATAQQLEAYLNDNRERFVAQLMEWLAIPSISTLDEHRDDVRRAAAWALARMEAIGFPDTRLISTTGHPLVYAEWLVDPKRPTLLVYGHYDVQPVDPVDRWQTAPFSPSLRDGSVFARGASDDKAQVLLVLAAIEAWVVVDGVPPVNLKVLLEGEEEAGGESIADFVRHHRQTLQADAALVCDTHMVGPTQPSLITGLRGILYTEITVSGAKSDLHSGSYGGVAPNPLHGLCLLISRLKGEDGSIKIPELQAATPTPPEPERTFFREDPLQLGPALCAEMGVDQLVGESAYPPLERIGLRPTLEVHGIAGGYTGKGAKTVIPATATAKVSLRLPPLVDPDQVFGWLDQAIQKQSPAGHRVHLTKLHTGKGLQLRPDNRYLLAAARALESVYGVPPVMMREGGSIPIAALFDQLLRLPVVLMGFGLPDDRIHAPNEKFSLDQFDLGMKAVAAFLAELTAA